MVKSFIRFYLIQYHKNAFHDELFLSVYSILQMELYFAIFVKNDSQILALGYLESVADKNGCTWKKNQLIKKFSTRKLNFELAKFTLSNYKILISTRKAAMQLVNLSF